ncbi:SDR family oxidoreductase [Halopseudomonas pelagia]|uniref:SDR family oxidoreductase n=1 Tax=Halopseudomonas pelagia TaxID=553151 RepID=A0AA91U5M6_9GAMM|nr:SDR family oxidoreductase [Halopseudomonas pelagia]PCD00512.1 short chain dehydrogenase [Halopseudomonas pelagia]QFY55215.1 SDR family oxidoreductase [Halopseudomonas pelagia]
MRLQDSVVVLTGATGGMGYAMVAALCQAGARVLLVGRQANALRAMEADFGSRVSSVQADLRLPEDRARVVAAARQLPGFNLLVNAAGVNHFGLFESMDDAAIAELIGINLTANLQLTRALLPLLKAAPQACVVNIGSTFGSIGYAGFSTYCASKFALRGFSQALRRELADTRVGVLYLAPRATNTEMNSTQVNAMNRFLGVATDSPELVAAQLIRALQRDLREVHLGWPERLFVRLNGLLPSLMDKALHRQLPTIQHYAKFAAAGAVAGSSAAESQKPTSLLEQRP